jgi:hypothetical protein
MDNNPLKQYFRRPAVYIKLPSNGKGYCPDSIDMPENGELPVYPMTAIDEITGRTPDGLYNGSAVVDIIKSCIPNIKNPWEVNATDLDTLLLAIKSASGDGTLEVNSTCQNTKCGNEATFSLQIAGLMSTLSSGNYDDLLSIYDLHIKFKPIKFKHVNDAAVAQFEITKAFSQINDPSVTQDDRIKIGQDSIKRITDITMEIVTKSIEYVTTPETVVTNEQYILDFLKNCDKKTYAKIRDYSTDLKTKSEIQPLKIKCANCGHEYDQTIAINPSDFFG